MFERIEDGENRSGKEGNIVKDEKSLREGIDVMLRIKKEEEKKESIKEIVGGDGIKIGRNIMKGRKLNMEKKDIVKLIEDGGKLIIDIGWKREGRIVIERRIEKIGIFKVENIRKGKDKNEKEGDKDWKVNGGNEIGEKFMIWIGRWIVLYWGIGNGNIMIFKKER